MKKCNKEIYYCDNFLRLYSNSIKLENKYLKEWCDNNMDKIVWDSDLMDDLENMYFENCIPVFGDNLIFKNELSKRYDINAPVYREDSNTFRVQVYS